LRYGQLLGRLFALAPDGAQPLGSLRRGGQRTSPPQTSPPQRTQIPTLSRPSANSLYLLRHLEQVQGERDARLFQFFGEFGNDSGGPEAAQDFSIRSQSLFFEKEDILQADDVTVGARHLRDMGHASRAIAHARNLHDNVDGGGDLIPQRLFGKAQVRHKRHGLDARESVARTVGVDRGQRTVVPGVHRLEHVECLATPHFPDDNAVRTHTESVDYQLPLMDRPFAFHVWWPAFQADYVPLLQLQFG